MTEDDAQSSHEPLEGLLTEFFHDQMPSDLVAACEELFTWRTIDAELAQLEDDDVLDGMAAGVRSVSVTATLTFASEGLRVEIEYDPEARRISGQVFPAGPATVTFTRPQGASFTVEATPNGTFEVAKSPAGPLQIVVDAAGKVVRTDWIVLQSVVD